MTRPDLEGMLSKYRDTTFEEEDVVRYALYLESQNAALEADKKRMEGKLERIGEAAGFLIASVRVGAEPYRINLLVGDLAKVLWGNDAAIKEAK